MIDREAHSARHFYISEYFNILPDYAEIELQMRMTRRVAQLENKQKINFSRIFSLIEM